MNDVVNLSHIIGLADAAVGFHVNDFGNTVVVYDMSEIECMFNSRMEMVDYLEKGTESLPEPVRPIFIRLDRHIGDQLRVATAHIH